MRTRDSERRALQAWRRLMRSRDPTRRTDAVNSPPPGAPSEKIVPQLLRALDDEHELVRTCAADSLEEFPCDEVRHGLRERVSKERGALARGYLLYTLGRIGTLKDLAFVCAALAKERTVEGQIFAAHGLFLGIRRAAIEVLLPTLSAYELTVGVCRALADVCSGSDDPRVIDAIRSRIAVETGSRVVDMDQELQDIIANYEVNTDIGHGPGHQSRKRSKSRVRRGASKKKRAVPPTSE